VTCRRCWRARWRPARAGALLTFSDDATGERSELPAEVLGGWAARTANLLIDGEARRHPGEFRAPVLLRDADPASFDGTSYARWGLLAQETAVALGIRPGDRVLVDAAAHDHPVTWLLAPLAAGASVVLCANLDPSKVAARAAAERVTRVL
jgi:hypothetical protein